MHVFIFLRDIGNDIIVTVLLCEQTSLSERTSAMAYITLAQALGFIVGPGTHIHY